MVNAQHLQGQWNVIRGKVKEKWADLTDDDLRMQDGNIDQLIGRIQKKTGEARDKIEHFIDDLTSRASSSASSAAQSVGDFAHQASGRLRENFSQAAGQFNDGYERAEGLVRERPAESVLAAFGIGVALGVIVGIAIRGR